MWKFWTTAGVGSVLTITLGLTVGTLPFLISLGCTVAAIYFVNDSPVD